jgi:large subunit ribosomal protein L22
MNVISTTKYARISAFKAREVTREIQGLPVSAALDLLAFTPRKAALLISKTLKSAIANAENNNNLRAESLVVREAVVGEGPTMKRFQPKARGSAGPIRKRTSHIRIIVTDEIAIETRSPKKPSSRKKSDAPKSKSKSAKKDHPPAEEPAVETPVAETPEAAAPHATAAAPEAPASTHEAPAAPAETPEKE